MPVAGAVNFLVTIYWPVSRIGCAVVAVRKVVTTAILGLPGEGEDQPEPIPSGPD
jgi:hypothetical protein